MSQIIAQPDQELQSAAPLDDAHYRFTRLNLSSVLTSREVDEISPNDDGTVLCEFTAERRDAVLELLGALSMDELKATADRVTSLYWRSRARTELYGIDVGYVMPYTKTVLDFLQNYPDRRDAREVGFYLLRGVHIALKHADTGLRSQGEQLGLAFLHHRPLPPTHH